MIGGTFTSLLPFYVNFPLQAQYTKQTIHNKDFLFCVIKRWQTDEIYKNESFG